MPKPRTIARQQRRIARDVADGLVLRFLQQLYHAPPLPVLLPLPTPDVIAAFRNQIERVWCPPRARTYLRSPTLAHGDTGATGATDGPDKPADGA